MEIYKNLGGNSGVSAFEIAHSSITVQFTSGATYLYTCTSAGSSHIEEMKSLAHGGRGLNSYMYEECKNKL